MLVQVPGESVCRGEDGGGQRVLPPPLFPLLLLRPTAGLYQRLRRSRQQGEDGIMKISLNGVNIRQMRVQFLLTWNTWVGEACPPCRRVAATSSGQCGWPCPSRTCLLAPAWPRTCYILTLSLL
jgi:hypothetical protein